MGSSECLMWAVGRPAFEIIKRSEQIKQMSRVGYN